MFVLILVLNRIYFTAISIKLQNRSNLCQTAVIGNLWKLNLTFGLLKSKDIFEVNIPKITKNGHFSKINVNLIYILFI